MTEHPPFGSLLASSPLYAILDTEMTTACRPDLSPLQMADALLRAGVKVIQYRHKEAFRRAQWEQCSELAEMIRRAGGCFVVNDRADIAKACGADGVHLGQDDLPPDKARLFTGAGMYIGFSTHNIEQFNAALRMPVDYIAVGPVFATSTKKNPDPVVGLDLVRQARALTTLPLVAIGGITIENATSVLEAGADAVAVIADLLRASDMEARAREFLAVLDQSRSQKKV